ncbi:hypothetical protein [Providencia sp. PROV119]|uniref:hypothetical protein n=1 Tax=Providencia sp. PROV119 TaxID=2949830 RepID=UPI00234A2717|nr:hypothetical protein [Providencia sp. PROV119]
MDSEQSKLNWKFITFGSVFPLIIPFFREKARITPVSLDKQNLFWIAIFSPIVYFFLLGCIAWSGTEIDRSWNGFNKFLEISKLPLGILALSPIFGVFVSSVHRTIQTEKQIIVTENKNNSDYFKMRYERIKDIISSIIVYIDKPDDFENIERYFNLVSTDMYKVKIEENKVKDTLEVKCNSSSELFNEMYLDDRFDGYSDFSTSGNYVKNCTLEIKSMKEYLESLIEKENYGKVKDIVEYKPNIKTFLYLTGLSSKLKLNIESLVALDPDFDFNFYIGPKDSYHINFCNDYSDSEKKVKYKDTLIKAIYFFEMTLRYRNYVYVSTEFLRKLLFALHLKELDIEKNEDIDFIIKLSSEVNKLIDKILLKNQKVLMDVLFKLKTD